MNNIIRLASAILSIFRPIYFMCCLYFTTPVLNEHSKRIVEAQDNLWTLAAKLRYLSTICSTEPFASDSESIATTGDDIVFSHEVNAWRRPRRGGGVFFEKRRPRANSSWMVHAQTPTLHLLWFRRDEDRDVENWRRVNDTLANAKSPVYSRTSLS